PPLPAPLPTQPGAGQVAADEPRPARDQRPHGAVHARVLLVSRHGTCHPPFAPHPGRRAGGPAGRPPPPAGHFPPINSVGGGRIPPSTVPGGARAAPGPPGRNRALRRGITRHEQDDELCAHQTVRGSSSGARFFLPKSGTESSPSW